MLWTHELHEFDFFELMLANHAARIATIAARLAAKTRRVADVFDAFVGQLLGIENHIAREIGHRHFGSRNQIKIFLNNIALSLVNRADTLQLAESTLCC